MAILLVSDLFSIFGSSIIDVLHKLSAISLPIFTEIRFRYELGSQISYITESLNGEGLSFNASGLVTNQLEERFRLE